MNSSPLLSPADVVVLLIDPQPGLAFVIESQSRCTLENRVGSNDTFTDYFVFRPNTKNSIWVTMGKLVWSWGGTTTLKSGSWTTPTATTQPSNPGGSSSNELPTWPAVFNAPTPASLCAPIPGG